MSASLAVMNGSISASLRHEVSAAAVHRQNAPRSHAVILFCCFMIVSVYLLEFFQQQVINIPTAIFLRVGGYRVDGNLRIGRDTIKIERVVDRKSTRLNSSHANISYAVFCLKKKTNM